MTDREIAGIGIVFACSHWRKRQSCAMRRLLALGVTLNFLIFALTACPVLAQSIDNSWSQRELWPGVRVSLPRPAVIQNQRRPIPRVLKQVTISTSNHDSPYLEAVVDLVRENRGLPYGVEFERRWRRQFGHRQITMRETGNSYWASYMDQGRWCFNRKIRISSTQMVEAYFSVPLKERYSKETRRMRAIVMSISLRKR